MPNHPLQCRHCGLPVPKPRRITPRKIADTPASHFCCYGCRIAYALSESASQDNDTTPPNTLLLRLGFGIVVTLNIMVFNWLFLWQHVFDPTLVNDPAAALAPLASWASYLLLFLCTLVIATLGLPMAVDLIGNFKTSVRLDTNLLILIGVFAAYILSVINTLRGEPTLYFDTAALILVLVTLGHYLDSRTKLAATAATNTLLESLPNKVLKKGAQGFDEVDLSEIQRGDIIRVRPGEVIAADGHITDGRGHIHEAHLTGESLPRTVSKGQRVYAGSTAIDTQFTIAVDNIGDDLLISQMQQMLEQARLQQPAIQRLADRVAAFFIPLVVTLSIIVFIINTFLGQPVDGLLNALAVLLISCPCALGLAAPLATWSAIGKAARHGILIESGPTLEKAARIKRLFIDKTGTLTANELNVLWYQSLDENSEDHQILAIAGALAATSNHPVSKAISKATDEFRMDVADVKNIVNHPGLGVSGEIDSKVYRLGREHRGDVKHFDHSIDAQPTIEVYLCNETATLGHFLLGEELRNDADETISRLRHMNIEVQILTGDRPAPANRIADRLGVKVHSQLLPTDKQHHVEQWRLDHCRSRHTVAMVGDGINDSPVLAAADIGFAVGSATDLARQAGNIHLTTDRLIHIPQTIAVARHAMRRIKLNLVWAFSYNTVGLALAAAGLLNPIFAAIAMLGSSLLIVLTSKNAGNIEFDGWVQPGAAVVTGLDPDVVPEYEIPGTKMVTGAEQNAAPESNKGWLRHNKVKPRNDQYPQSKKASL